METQWTHSDAIRLRGWSRMPISFTVGLMIFFLSLATLAGPGHAQNFRSEAPPAPQRPDFELILDQRVKNPEAVRAFVEQVWTSLPKQMRESISGITRISFDLDPKKSRQPVRPPDCEEGTDRLWLVTTSDKEQVRKAIENRTVYAEMKTDGFLSPIIGHVHMHPDWIRIIENGVEKAEAFNCGHKNMHRMAQAVLNHEIGHIYDSLNRYAEVNLDEKYKRMNCRAMGPKANHLSQDCAELNQISTSVSTRPLFQALSGLDGKKNQNGSTVRVPDAHEMTNAKEFFAVNFEYYMMDPLYKCRRPLQYNYLSSHFGESRFADYTCPSELFFAEPFRAQEHIVDPARVFEVDLLISGKTNDGGINLGVTKVGISSFGHSMIRLVVCAPERKEVSEACRLDTSHHIVLSFQAEQDSLVLNMWYGIIGRYPAVPFVHSFKTMVEKSTQKELRDLESYPLHITEAEKNNLLRDLAQNFWSYKGTYKFLWNNCATEAFRLINASLSQTRERDDRHWRELIMNESAIETPYGVLEKLSEMGLTDPADLKLPNKLYKSQRGHITQMIHRFFPSEKISPQASLSNLINFFGQYPAVQRLEIYKTVIFADFKNRAEIATQAQSIEVYYMYLNARLTNKRINGFIGEMLTWSNEQKANARPVVKVLLERFDEIMRINDSFLKNETSRGYGLVQMSDLSTPQVRADFYDSTQKKLTDIGDGIRELFPDGVSDLERELKMTSLNYLILNQLRWQKDSVAKEASTP